MKSVLNFRVFIIVVLLLALLALQRPGGLIVFMSKPIKGAVVDAASGKPIEGVIVTASWMMYGMLDAHAHIGAMNASEAVTDSRGQFTLAAWGPKISFNGYLDDDEPNIRFFRPGYVPLVIRNNSVYHPGFEGDREHLLKKEIFYNAGRKGIRMIEPEEHRVRFGKKEHTFLLETFDGTNAEYVKLLDDVYVDSTLRFHLMSGKECIWKQLPQTFIALQSLKTNLNRLNVNINNLPGFSSLGGQNTRCGSAEEYFKEQLK